MGRKRPVGRKHVALLPLVLAVTAAAIAILLYFSTILATSRDSSSFYIQHHPKLKEQVSEPPGLDKATFELNFSKTYDVCTVGAGLSGAIFAERFANVLDKSALVLDSRHHVGGNCYDFVDQSTGILMNKYGAHLFRTNDERAWRYINMHESAPKWVRYQHQVRGWIGKRLLPIPVNAYTVNALFNLSLQTEEEMNEWLTKVQIPCPKSGCETAEQLIKSRVGEQLYKAIFYDYTVKQWNKEPGELKPAAAARIPVYSSFDPRYFTAKYQVLPSKGYTAWFEALLDHPMIDVVLKTDFFEHRAHLEKACGLIVYTGPIDSYFGDSGLEKLEYRSIEFVEKRYFDVGYVQAASVVNYPSKDVKFTRSVEYKHFLFQDHAPHSIVVSERSTDKGDPYYPVPSQRNLQLYAKYKKLAEAAEASGSVLFVGRLANYKYFSMDEAIVNAIKLFQETAMKLEPIDALSAGKLGEEVRLFVQNSVADEDSKCSNQKWRSFLEKAKNMITWASGAKWMRGACLGLTSGHLHSATFYPHAAPMSRSKIHLAKVAIIIRGHFRYIDNDTEATNNLRLLLKKFPNAKVFLQSWTVRQTSNSWRQKLLQKPSANSMLISKRVLREYYQIPRKNFGGIQVDSEKQVMPDLKHLYERGELFGNVCSRIPGHNSSWAPNVGWLQMWWGIVQASKLVVQSGIKFDAVLNMRHDAYREFSFVIPDWKNLADLIVRYLEHVRKSPTDISCWLFSQKLSERIGVDTAYVTGAWSNYRLSTKWLYSYKAMQDIFCRANLYINQEELVPISAVLLQ